MGFDTPADRVVHKTDIRVRFYELDPYNHVNHTNYFAYFETARIEYLAATGWALDVLKDQGLQLVVVEIEARFLAAAEFGDVLGIETWVADIGRVRTTWRQTMHRGDELVATLIVSAAFTDLSGRPRRVPAEFAIAFGSRS